MIQACIRIDGVAVTNHGFRSASMQPDAPLWTDDCSNLYKILR